MNQANLEEKCELLHEIIERAQFDEFLDYNRDTKHMFDNWKLKAIKLSTVLSKFFTNITEGIIYES